MDLELVDVAGPAGTLAEHRVEDGELAWSIANGSAEPLAVDRVRARLRITGRAGRLRALSHGWQSWSPCGGAVVGEHVDVSLDDRSPGAFRAAYHADPAAIGPGEVRSELVAALADDSGGRVLGADGGSRHDTTFLVRGDELVIDAYLGGAVLAPGERRDLHAVALDAGDLDGWAGWAGRRAGARTTAPYQVGWCSWYQYFHDVTERDVRANLALAGGWPVDVFQLDDGYQAAIGDWLDRAPTFPSPLEDLAADIDAAGFVPGIWIAPFLASPASAIAAARPEWLVERGPGRPLIGMVNPGWGGEQFVLDTTNPEVLAHLEHLARTLVAMGWCYLKLDFTYAPSFHGRWHDPSRTPAERVRAGYDAIRRGAGDDAFILGCGAPLGACIGAVDGMRIGPDVAPAWAPDPTGVGYDDAVPATLNAWRNTLARSFQHRRLWLNDPDCLMLRTTGTRLSPAQVEAWAFAVAASGGMALLSDDLAALGPDARCLLDDVLAVGRAVDACGAPASCPDLLDAWTPTTLRSPVADLVGDPLAGTATLTPRPR